MSKKSEKVHVITYQRVLVGDNLFVFVPCNVEGGTYMEADKYFINDSGIAYTSCDDYESLKDSRFQTYYYFPKPDNDMMEYYQTPFIEEAAGYYFDDLRNGLLVGFMDDKSMSVTVQYLSKEIISALNNPVSYQLYQGHGTVTLTKEQMIKLLNSRDLKTIKKELGRLIQHSKNIEKAFAKKQVEHVTMSANGNKILGFQKEQPKVVAQQEPSVKPKMSPAEVEQYIKDRYVGQYHIAEDITAIIFHNLNADIPEAIIRPLLIGESGSGKSYIFKLLRDCLDVPVIIYDSNSITQAGYEGKSVNDLLVDAYYQCGKNKALLERAIFYVDEFDKIANRGSYVSDVGAQNSLLKFFEGSDFVVELDRTGMSKLVVNTSRMTLCAGGAFEGIVDSKRKKLGFVPEAPASDLKISREDIIKYGFEKQLIARFEYIGVLNPVTPDMIREQLYKSKSSQLIINEELFMRLYGVDLKFSKGYVDRLINTAIGEKTGFRGIKNIVVKSLLNAEFVLQKDEHQHYELTITEETIDNPKKYVLV